MKLKENQTLWGIPVVHLKEHSKKYRLYSSILYVLDIILVVILTLLMYYTNISYSAYGFVIVAICLLFHFISYYKLNPEKWEAFKFYKKYSECKIITKTYALDENKLYSLLYCIGYKRLKQNRSFDEYKELILSACCENCAYSKSLMKYMKKYESESGNLSCLIIKKGKKQYFIDFVNDENNGGNSDECDNTGNITDDSAESAD
jgi:hypothetical protein